MNKKRRAEILAIHSRLCGLIAEIESVQSDEQEYFDAMPESLQNGQRGEASTAAIDALETAAESVNDGLIALIEASEV